MIKKKIIYLFFLLPLTLWSQVNFDLSTTLSEEYLFIDIEITGDESIEIGSTNFPFSITGLGLDHDNALKVDEFDLPLDPQFYEGINFFRGDFYHVFLLRNVLETSGGENLNNIESIRVARIAIPILDVCESVNISWITDRGEVTNMSGESIKDIVNYSEDLFLNIMDIPEIPEIINNEEVLEITTTNNVSIQWLLDGEPIEGANEAQFTPIEDGEYSVEISNSCHTISSAVEQVSLITGINEELVSEIGLNIYPNPIAQDFSVKFNLRETSEVEIYLTNLEGKIIYTFEKGRLKSGDYDNHYSLGQEINATDSGYLLVFKKDNEIHSTQVAVLNQD